VVAKQLTGHTQLALTNAEAGALTEATTKAMKLTCDYVMGPNSTLFERRDGDRGVTTAPNHIWQVGRAPRATFSRQSTTGSFRLLQ